MHHIRTVAAEATGAGKDHLGILSGEVVLKEVVELDGMASHISLAVTLAESRQFILHKQEHT